jgi:hypothetical protein
VVCRLGESADDRMRPRNDNKECYILRKSSDVSGPGTCGNNNVLICDRLRNLEGPQSLPFAIRAIQTGVFESDIRISNRPFLDLYDESVSSKTGRKAKNVERKKNTYPSFHPSWPSKCKTATATADPVDACILLV